MTPTQEAKVFARLTALEESVNNIMVALSRLVTRDQVTQLLVIQQTEQADQRQTLEALENRVELLENEPLS